MKKIALLFLMLGFFAFAQEPDVVESYNVPVPKYKCFPSIPRFSDPEVQKYTEDYTVFIKEYIKAARAKDATKLAELSKSAQEWGIRSSSISSKLASNPEDMKKFSDYAQLLVQCMSDALSS